MVFDGAQTPVSLNNLHFAEGYAVLSIFEGDISRMLLWDCFSNVNEAPDVSQAVSSIGKLDCERLNRQLKTQLEERGINVYYGQEGAGDFPDYTAQVVTDQELIYRGLTQLMSTIKKFPDGFFNDLLSEEVRGIDIYLCGAFTPINPEWGIDTASAFAVVYNSRQIIAMNLDYIYSFEQTLAHEFMHAIERRIQQMVWDGQIERGLILWDAFLPENYYYANSYRAPEPNTTAPTARSIPPTTRQATATYPTYILWTAIQLPLPARIWLGYLKICLLRTSCLISLKVLIF